MSKYKIIHLDIQKDDPFRITVTIEKQIQEDTKFIKFTELTNGSILTADRVTTFQGSSNCHTISVLMDDWELGSTIVQNKKFEVRYTINTDAKNRILKAIGYDEGGKERASTEIKVDVINQIPDNFNKYILKAVEDLSKDYGLLGYNISGVLTHDIPFGYGVIKAREKYKPKTMCVAAVMEVMLVAYNIYYKKTKDDTVFKYQPKSSYERLRKNTLRGHIWVNHKYNSYGTADALINFGMGKRVEFEDLEPGDFINLNRSKTGHAVVFLGFINKEGDILPQHSSSVIGFKYFSSQGSGTPGKGGFGFRNAVFKEYGIPYFSDTKGDYGVIYSKKQNLLNTGRMLMPKDWNLPKHADIISFIDTEETWVNKEIYDNSEV